MTSKKTMLFDTYPGSKLLVVGDTKILVANTYEYLPGWPIFRKQKDGQFEHIANVFNTSDVLDFSEVRSGEGLSLTDLKFDNGEYQISGKFTNSTSLSERQGSFTITSTDLISWREPVWGPASVESSEKNVESALTEIIKQERNGEYALDDETLVSIRGNKKHFLADHKTMKLQSDNINAISNVSYVGFRQTHLLTTISADFEIDFDPARNEEVGLAVRKNDTDYIKFAVYKDIVKIVHRQHDVASVPSSKVNNLTKFNLRVETDIAGQYHFFFNNEELGSIDGETLSAEIAGGVFGITIGPFATANGQPTKATVKITNLIYCTK